MKISKRWYNNVYKAFMHPLRTPGNHMGEELWDGLFIELGNQASI